MPLHAGPKRKDPPSPELTPGDSNGSSVKRQRPTFSDRSRYQDSSVEEMHGIVLRKYYPPELTNERAKQYATGELERPIETLQKALAETAEAREKITGGQAVVFWFKQDLRTTDNRGLDLAAKKAKRLGVPLICVYLVSPQDWEAHLTAPVRVDFMLRCLEVLKADLADLEIPLYVEIVSKRRMVGDTLLRLCQDWGARHVFCNMEYEVDELRREALLVREALGKEVAITALHDTCVVQPGVLKTGAGGQISIYSPWHRKWCAHLNANPHELDEADRPQRNPTGSRKKLAKLFDSNIPEAPEGKRLDEKEKEHFRNMWPAGEHEARDRLDKFVKERVLKYHELRNLPGGNGTSTLSAHLAAGTIAARTCVRVSLLAAPSQTVSDDRKQGHSMWYGEVAWRDFYKHVLCNWPYICMNKPFKAEYSKIEWEYDQNQFQAWTDGKTGFPIVDAAMRQARNSGSVSFQYMSGARANAGRYMHNRCRMIVASFLAKDLMIDWRMGEKWFMEHLIDGDFASNNGGWGFSASCGVDPQPYFRIFNPLLQSEKFDLDGAYIRKWVPELREVKGKAIHDPYGRGAEAIAKKNGYPKPLVVHKEARERALARYKAGIGRSTA